LKPADLTIPQWDAVDHYLGPLLVLAGPGSGKTRVITRRIARLVERGVPPWQILAITFTNKAANEMAARVEKLLPGTRVWVSTFHRLCANLLRRHAAAVGLQPNFTILDTTDQTQLLRDVLTELDVDSKHFPPGRLLHRIGQAKNRMLTAEQFLQESEQSGGMHDQLVARVYTKYEAALLKSNAVDFDDLLLHVCRLLAENEEVRSALDQRYQFVLVDEYQDTNLAQYQIVNALSRDYPNLCATGDPDQSIYGWRGAEIGNILRFEHDYSDAKVVRL
jgi:DNA helicase II / ATP-dependent DNA helicase PcrA